MKQTSVEWLVKYLSERGYIQAPSFGHSIIDKAIKQAKEMEKEQISIAYKEGWNCPHGEGFPETGEQYYNETYESNT
jgi:hypothetical protein